jgi:UTP-glucose-1-phosphate uridylyltransferase
VEDKSRINVMFSDETQTKIVAVFSCPQDEGNYANLGMVEPQDQRYLTYMSESPVDPQLSPSQIIASERYRREGLGIVVGSMAIETSRDSQALIASTGLSAILDPEYRCNFKTLNGFVEIGAEQILAIAKAVRAHVQACFDRELELLRAIEAGTYTDEMLKESWPDSLPATSVSAPQ